MSLFGDILKVGAVVGTAVFAPQLLPVVAGGIGALETRSNSRRAAGAIRAIDMQTIEEIKRILEEGLAAEEAALAQGNAEAIAHIREAVAQQLAIYDDLIDNVAPERFAAIRAIFSDFTQAGRNALEQQQVMLGLKGDFDPNTITSRPSFKFVQEQGDRAVSRTAAARLGTLSGRAVKESQRFAAGLASQEFDNEFNRLGTISALGANAAANEAQQINAAYTDLFNVILGKAGVFGAQGEALANIALNNASSRIQISQNRTNGLIGLVSADGISQANQVASNNQSKNSFINDLVSLAPIAVDIFSNRKGSESGSTRNAAARNSLTTGSSLVEPEGFKRLDRQFFGANAFRL